MFHTAIGSAAIAISASAVIILFSSRSFVMDTFLRRQCGLRAGVRHRSHGGVPLDLGIL